MTAANYEPDGRFGENKNRVLHMLSQSEDPVPVSDIGEHLGINMNALKVCLHRLVKSGQAVRVHRGEYMASDAGKV
jgi:predicted ArsR family transcriptional regulator